MGRGDERDRRRTEARRYPIDDTELLAELREQAVLAGEKTLHAAERGLAEGLASLWPGAL